MKKTLKILCEKYGISFKTACSKAGFSISNCHTQVNQETFNFTKIKGLAEVFNMSLSEFFVAYEEYENMKNNRLSNTFQVPEKFRIKLGRFGSTAAVGNNGAFQVRIRNSHRIFSVIASDGAGWEHVSVSLPDRCPTWPEMCAIKKIFWSEEDCVIQYHPAKSEYINNNNYCLHLWKHSSIVFPTPDKILVGI